jgi:hypothetical protein
MIKIIIIYLTIGLIYTMIMDWLLKNYSPKGQGLGFKHSMYNIFIWPLAMYLVYHAFKNDNDEGI